MCCRLFSSIHGSNRFLTLTLYFLKLMIDIFRSACFATNGILAWEAILLSPFMCVYQPYLLQFWLRCCGVVQSFPNFFARDPFQSPKIFRDPSWLK